MVPLNSPEVTSVWFWLIMLAIGSGTATFVLALLGVFNSQLNKPPLATAKHPEDLANWGAPNER